MSFITSLAIGVQVSLLEAASGQSYFKSVGQVASSNVFSNMMTFMLFWIMMYNVVYVV